MNTAKSPKRRSPLKSAGSPKKNATRTVTSYYYTDLGITEKAIEIDHLKTVIVSLDQKTKVVSDIQSELETKGQVLANSEKARDDLHAQLREYIRKSEDDARKNKEFQDQILAKNRELEETNNRQRHEIELLRSEKSERDQTILQHSNTIMRLEQELNIRIDVERQLADARAHVADLEDQKDKLKKDLTIASDYLLEQDQKVHQANQTSLELLQHLKDAEIEIETLKAYIIELKHRIAVYIPTDGDMVDERLAEYINNYPERNRLKIMFMRESSGVYQFGSKRIYVKVEQDKIIIRVGGGYLTIDEFLDIYTPLEIEKLERKSPINVTRTITASPTRSTRSPTRTSPLRKSSPNKRSPKKA
jgi:hypothetical protein